MKKAFEYLIKRVENGFIVIDKVANGTGRYGKEYCFTDFDHVWNFLVLEGDLDVDTCAIDDSPGF